MDNGVSDFSHLRKLDVQGAAVAEFELVELEGNPVLVGVFAGETNAPYYNQLVKRSGKNSRRFRAGKLTTRELEDNREHDRELFPKHVIKSWRGVMDSRGEPAQFSMANCLAFLSALPNWLFDDVRNHFSNPVSFVDDPDDSVSAEEAEDLGNSPAPAFGGTSVTPGTDGQ